MFNVSSMLASLDGVLAEWPYPRIDPVIFWKVRWYGVSYIVAFGLAFLVLRGLSRRGRWPVHPERVGDVLFYGILGVFLGGRIGEMLLYERDKPLWDWLKVREGGMSFHGGFAGVFIAYFIYAWRHKIRLRDIYDGLALAAAPGICIVRIANFINAELLGYPWNGPWAMTFPHYKSIGQEDQWEWETFTRHPSQLYQALGEGLLNFVILRWLMIRRGWGGGRIIAAFLVLYGSLRFGAEYFRVPETSPWFEWLGLTLGQELCLGMLVIGIGMFAYLRITRSQNMPVIDWSKYAPDGTPIEPAEASVAPPPPPDLGTPAS